MHILHRDITHALKCPKDRDDVARQSKGPDAGTRQHIDGYGAEDEHEVCLTIKVRRNGD